MKFGELRNIVVAASIAGIDDNSEVVFQGNEEGEYDEPGTETPGHTSCMGTVYAAFSRNGSSVVDGAVNEFVIDCAITESEM